MIFQNWLNISHMLTIIVLHHVAVKRIFGSIVKPVYSPLSNMEL